MTPTCTAHLYRLCLAGERLIRALYGQAGSLPASLFDLGISPYINASIIVSPAGRILVLFTTVSSSSCVQHIRHVDMWTCMWTCRHVYHRSF